MIEDGVYNEEPVYYCTDCLSLRIVGVDFLDSEFCDKCNSTKIEKTSIHKWRELYIAKYGHDYLEEY